MIRMTRLMMAVTVLLLACWVQPAAIAQTPSTDVAGRVDELEKQIEKLRQEIAALKQTAAPPPAQAALATPTAPAAAPAADPLSGISSVLGGATFTGLVDGYYSFNTNSPGNHSSGNRFFDPSTNSFGLNLIEVGLTKAPDATSRLGYNVTLGFGNAMNVVNSGDPSFLQYVKESYVSYLAPVGKGLQFDAGKFVTPNGAEVIETNGNWNYSRGLLFYYAIPYYHFGLRAKYTFNDKVALTGYVVNGWNNVTQNGGSGKTGGVSLVLTPTKKCSFTENWMGGPGALPSDGGNWRNLSDTVIAYNPTAKLSLMANVDYGRVNNYFGSGKAAEWAGVAGYFKYQASPLWAVATRYEYYDDIDGVTTGVVGAQHMHEVTGTLERRIAQHLIARFEVRHDQSDVKSFLKGAATPVDGQTTVGGGLVFVFEPAR